MCVCAGACERSFLHVIIWRPESMDPSIGPAFPLIRVQVLYQEGNNKYGRPPKEIVVCNGCTRHDHLKTNMCTRIATTCIQCCTNTVQSTYCRLCIIQCCTECLVFNSQTTENASVKWDRRCRSTDLGHKRKTAIIKRKRQS